MKLNIETSYLDAIEIEKYQWVSVRLPSGHVVEVFDDMVYVATAEESAAHKDGKKVWKL